MDAHFFSNSSSYAGSKSVLYRSSIFSYASLDFSAPLNSLAGYARIYLFRACGGSMVFIWKYLIRPLGGIWNIYELLPAFLIACAAIVIVSLLTPKPSKEIEEEFDRVAQMK